MAPALSVDYEPPQSPTALAGLVLVGATVAALGVANSPLAPLYHPGCTTTCSACR